MLVQAQTYYMGVLYGIYRFDHESKTELRQWAEDIPLGITARILREEPVEGFHHY